MAKWFRNAIVYSLDVETFHDSNGDGVGDFQGLISKLDYIAGLGATCLWLLPFYPSPNHDNGYDVSDYYNIDARLGDLGDFVQLISKCKDLGIKVVIDLVINHTSREHPWFKAARKSKSSPFREFYIWSDKPKKFSKEDLLFSGEEHTIWTYDDLAGQYYLHRFYKEQPDLNYTSTVLRQEILKIVEFWLHMRVDGFRIDAAELLIENYGMDSRPNHHPESFLNDIRRFVQSINPAAVLIAEANILPARTKKYLTGDDRMHMVFSFFINQCLFLSAARENASILVKAFNALRRPTENQQWLNFLRQHDELSLRLLSDRDAISVLQAFAPHKQMRIFKNGIRRRLAPMVGNDQRKLRMLYSLLFALPGAVLIRYGDEIGMGEDLSLEGRASVRTPMQWSNTKNAGFSSAHFRSLVHPVIREGEFSYTKINVLSQQRDPDSLLNFIERLITTRKQTPEIGIGTYQFLKGPSRKLLVHRCQFENVGMLFMHNFSAEVFTIPVESLIQEHNFLVEIFCDGQSTLDEGLIILDSHGYIWLRIENNV